MHIPDSQISLVQRLVKQGRVGLCFNIFNLVLCISTDGYLILDKLGVWVCSTTTPVAPWHLLGVPSFTSFASFPCQSLPCLYLGVLLDYLSTRFLASLTLDLWLVLMSFSLFYISPNESSRTLAIIKPAKRRPTALDIGPKIRARWTRDNSKKFVL